MDALLAAVEKERELQRALVSALGWIDFDRVAEPARKLLDAELPFLRLIGLSTYAVHRQDPGPTLAKLISDEDPAVRVRALKAVGEMGRSDLLALTLDHLTDGDDKSRFYAAWSACYIGRHFSCGSASNHCRNRKPIFRAGVYVSRSKNETG